MLFIFPRTQMRVGAAALLASTIVSAALADTPASTPETPPHAVSKAAKASKSTRIARAHSPESIVVKAARHSQRQVQKYQNKPITASVVTSQQIAANQITNLQEAQKLQPSVQIKITNPRNVLINVRGFGNASSTATDGLENGVPVYVDGVYQARPGQAIFDIPDLDGVEVLKGPQGTLGGIDSTGGAIYLTTRPPSFVPEHSAEVSYGNYNATEVKLRSSGPIGDSDRAAFSLSGFTSDRDGYIKDVLNGRDYSNYHDKAVRAQLLLLPTDDLTIRIIADYNHLRESCCLYLFGGVVTNYANGAPVPNNFYQRAARIGYTPLPASAAHDLITDILGGQEVDQEAYGTSVDAKYRLPDDSSLDSITSFRTWNWYPHNANGGFAFDNVLAANNQVYEKNVTQEIRYTSPPDRPVEFSAGGFYMYEEVPDHWNYQYGSSAGAFYGNPATPAAAAIANLALSNSTFLKQDDPITNTYAVYARGTWHVTPRLDITPGIRYSYTSKFGGFSDEQYGASLAGLTPTQAASAVSLRNSLNGAVQSFSAHVSQGLPTALLTASYKFTPDILGYATYSRGGRPGGLNLVSLTFTGLVKPTVDPEEVDNYELGLKTEFFHDRLLLNTDVFWMADHNYITTAAIQSGASSISFLANAKEAISRGAELDLRAQPFNHFQTYLSATYDDTYYQSFANSPCPFELSNVSKTCNFDGKPLASTPKWAVSLGGEYSRPTGLSFPATGDLIGYIGADYTYETAYFSNTDDSIYSVIGDHGVLNLHAGIKPESERWDLTAWAHNALDRRYYTSVMAATTGGNLQVQPADPLMFGVTLKMKL